MICLYLKPKRLKNQFKKTALLLDSYEAVLLLTITVKIIRNV